MGRKESNQTNKYVCRNETIKLSVCPSILRTFACPLKSVKTIDQIPTTIYRVVSKMSYCEYDQDFCRVKTLDVLW